MKIEKGGMYRLKGFPKGVAFVVEIDDHPAYPVEIIYRRSPQDGWEGGYHTKEGRRFQSSEGSYDLIELSGEQDES